MRRGDHDFVEHTGAADLRPAGRSHPVMPADAVMVAACYAALGMLVPVALYQTKVVSHLPDPPFAIFDSEQITASKAAHPFGIPDGIVGLASFGATLGLILAARGSATAKKLLGVKLTMDAGAAAFNATRQVVSFGKLCSWCTGTALAAGVMAYCGRESIRETLASL